MQRHQGLAASFAAAAMLAWSVGAASATSFGTIYNFASDAGDANTPYAGLVIDAAGRLSVSYTHLSRSRRAIASASGA